MRKRDCLYLHALCALLREEVEKRREFDADAFESYERLEVSPAELHRPKTDHREAVTELLDTMSTALGGRDERVPVQTSASDEPDSDESC